MEFSLWDIAPPDAEAGQLDYFIELNVEFVSDKKFYEIYDNLKEMGLSQDEINEGNFAVFIRHDFELDTNEVNNGGFAVVNPETKSDLYFLKENSELIGTGYQFDKKEMQELKNIVHDSILEYYELNPHDNAQEQSKKVFSEVYEK